MYDIIKNVILAGNFELNDMTEKIYTFWIEGSISKDQFLELMDMARKKANPENSYASVEKRVEILENLVKSLVERIDILEGKGGSGEPTEEWPAFVTPTGAGDAYFAGDKITYDGVRYICIAPEGIAVVWSPAVFPDYWEGVEEEDNVEPPISEKSSTEV